MHYLYHQLVLAKLAQTTSCSLLFDRKEYEYNRRLKDIEKGNRNAKLCGAKRCHRRPLGSLRWYLISDRLGLGYCAFRID